MDADRLILATHSALQADGELLGPTERGAIDEAIRALRALETDDASIIEAASKQLAQATEGFAAMRMNQSIQQALSGKT
ncbi:MAG: hypothetical protein WCH39_17825, partial [Schlesneria sp.]